MSTGPINPSSQSDHIPVSPPNADSQRKEPMNLSGAEWIKIESAVHRAIQQSTRNRQDQLQQPQLQRIGLSPILEDIDKRLDQLGSTALEHSNLFDSLKKIDSDDDSSEEEKERLGKRFEQLESEMKTSMQSMIQSYSQLHIENDFFSDWWNLYWIDEGKRKISLSYMKEQFLNRIFCRVLFLKKITEQVNGFKKEIISQFCDNANQIDFEKVTFESIPEGNETHNRGKVPSKIIFKFNHEPICTVFYKPREAYIDQKVIEAFATINDRLSSEEKSLDIDLPTYKIITLFDGNNHFSIWQFIEGKHLDGETADIPIKGLPAKDLLFQQLLRMEPICKFLEVSDLHSRNILFRNPNEMNARIFPIDLECIQPGNATGLFSEVPRGLRNLTEKEQHILKEFKQQIDHICYRFVPIPTSHFLGGLTRCYSFTMLADQVRQSIRSRNYTIRMQQDELEWLILNDFLYNDVPYLTEYRGQIYYGLPSEGRVIATR